MQLPTKTLLAILPYFLQTHALASGTGTTTRYWDCCKPSCAWPGKTTLLAGSNPVTTCDISDNPLTDYNAASGCNGGTSYMDSTQQPWAVSDDLAYGYAAVNIAGGSEDSWCCACYELTFTSGAVAGKKMVVQATNTGGDLGSNQFDLSIPGGGVGIYNGCTTEWGAPSSGWGAQYGGISSRSDCDSFPEALQAGCYWRFDWFMGSDNPTVSFTQVACPAAITKNSGCTRADDSSAPAADAASSAVAAVVVASSSSAKAAVVSTSSAVQEIATSAAQEVSSTVQEVATSASPVPSSSSSAAGVEISTSVAPVYTVSASPTSSAVTASTSAAEAESDDACEL